MPVGMNWVGIACRRKPTRIIAKELIMRNRMLAIAAIAGAASLPITAQARSDVTVGVAPTTGTVVSTPVEVDADGGIAVAQRPAFREYIIRERITVRSERTVLLHGRPAGGMIATAAYAFGSNPHYALDR